MVVVELKVKNFRRCGIRENFSRLNIPCFDVIEPTELAGNIRESSRSDVSCV
jgi:hypothetical protein